MPTSASLWTDKQTADHAWLASAPEPPKRPEPPAPPEPPRRRRWHGPALVALALVVGSLAYVGVKDLADGNDAPRAQKPEVLSAVAGATTATNINRIYAATSPGVVSVQAAGSGGGGGSGTGFVLDADGTIVTNAHVVDGAVRVRVRFDDKGSGVDAEVVGADPSSDLAVLKVDPSAAQLKPLALADSDKVKVGDLTVAIGYPLGLDRTATAGIVSGLGRQIEAPNGFQIDKVIQTDAPINPGNSGGPLLDARGRVIGVNSQIATAGSAGNVGIGFAVPSNTVREVVPQLKAGQTIERPFLGVSTSPSLSGDGAVVREVVSGGPAAQAGLRPSSSITGTDGDTIVSVDGKPVTSPDDVAQAINARKPGDKVDVVVRRGGDEVTVPVTLERRPDKSP